jgi:hypothetical protein
MSLTGLGEVTELATTVIGRIWPDKTEQEKAQIAAAVQIVQGQLDINKEEAKNPSVFVSGARPFILWVCGVALGYVSLVEPIARFVATVVYHYTGAFPVIDTTLTLQLLLGLLGLGGLRSLDKFNGVASK